MDDLDAELRLLAHRPPHPGLDGIDRSVLARIDAVQADRGSPGGIVVAAIGAVALGLVASLPGAGRAEAAQPMIDNRLAPSSLLFAAR